MKHTYFFPNKQQIYQFQPNVYSEEILLLREIILLILVIYVACMEIIGSCQIHNDWPISKYTTESAQAIA